MNAPPATISAHDHDRRLADCNAIRDGGNEARDWGHGEHASPGAQLMRVSLDNPMRLVYVNG